VTLAVIDWSAVGWRAAVVVAGVAIWIWTQALIGRRKDSGEALGDRIHDWTARWHAWFLAHPRATNRALILSSLWIDVFGLFLIGAALFGPSFAPFLAILVVFGMRQICQGLCSLPPPQGMIWHDPGFPSLLVTYGVANDLFFSGHTALAVLGAIEASAVLPPWLAGIAVVIALGQMIFMIVLRAHYTLDVIAGLFAAFVGHSIAVRSAPWVDGLLK